MAPETLPLLTKEILDECPRLRVLVVGMSGVGKSSLVSYAFGVPMKNILHSSRGVCDINTEIISPQNLRFVLHDSMGFEPGETTNFKSVKRFLESHSGKGVALQDRVHVIWLCIQIPYAGGRLLETHDENFLKLASDIKVVVFTKFDYLVELACQDLPDDASDETIEELCAEKAEMEFQKLCVKPLRRVNPELPYARSSGLSGKEITKPDRQALEHLIQVTRDVTEIDVEGQAWIVSAMAQRASSRVKIVASIEVGMRRYWKGLASSTKFLGSTFEKCLDTVHEEMTDSWNFYDPDDLLLGLEFRKKIKTLTQLVTADDLEAKSLFANLTLVQSWVGLAGATVAAAAGPAVAAIGLTTWFTNFGKNLYHNTPEALRCFMGYIIDLTLVLNELFLADFSMTPPCPLTNAEIDKALENYKNLNLGRVHHDIRQYVRKASVGQILESDAAEMKVKELILKYSSDRNRTSAKTW